MRLVPTTSIDLRSNAVTPWEQARQKAEAKLRRAWRLCEDMEILAQQNEYLISLPSEAFVDSCWPDFIREISRSGRLGSLADDDREATTIFIFLPNCKAYEDFYRDLDAWVREGQR